MYTSLQKAKWGLGAGPPCWPGKPSGPPSPPQLSDTYPLSSLLDSRGKSHWAPTEQRGDRLDRPLQSPDLPPEVSTILATASRVGEGAGLAESSPFWPPRASGKSQKKSHPPPMQCSPYVNHGHWGLWHCLQYSMLWPVTEPEGTKVA